MAAWPGGAQFKKTAGAKFDVIPQIPVREPIRYSTNTTTSRCTSKRFFFVDPYKSLVWMIGAEEVPRGNRWREARAKKD